MQPRLLSSPVRHAGAALLRLQSDEQLVALAADGHHQAYAVVVDRYRPALVRYASRVVGESRAEDAVQQALVSAHRALVNGSAPAELRPWLYRIVRNAALGLRDDAPEVEPLAELPGADGVAEQVERGEQVREALHTMATLPLAQRQAILLRELEGRSHEEIAVALSVSPAAARQHLYRAREAMRRAVRAIFPLPLLLQLLGTRARTPSNAAELAGGGITTATCGAGAMLVKAGTGVVVAGAIATGVVHGGVTRHHHPPPFPGRSEAEAGPARAERVHVSVAPEATGGEPRTQARVLSAQAPAERAAAPTSGRRPITPGAAAPARTSRAVATSPAAATAPPAGAPLPAGSPARGVAGATAPAHPSGAPASPAVTAAATVDRSVASGSGGGGSGASGSGGGGSGGGSSGAATPPAAEHNDAQAQPSGPSAGRPAKDAGNADASDESLSSTASAIPSTDGSD